MMSGSVCRCSVMVAGVMVACVVIAYALYDAINSGKPDTDKTAGTRAVPSLKFVVVVSRHGNRRPLFSFPNEPYPDKYWSCNLGEVTRKGKLQMFNLGKKVRSLYNGFLNITYSSNDLYATSTPLERTLVSGETFLAGLYPPENDQIWNEDILWQPIPIYTDSPDGSLIRNALCPQYTEEITKFKLEVYETNINAINNVSDYLNQHSGGNASQPNYLYSVWDSLSTDKIEGFSLPEWTKPVYPEPLSHIIGQQIIAISAGSDTITRIVSSELLIQIISLMKGKLNSTITNNYKMYYYSAHDMSIVALQAVLGVPRGSINGLVNPGSALLLELHHDQSSGSFVQVLYIDGLSPDLEPAAVNLPACHNTSCNFSQLLDITAKFRNFTSIDNECFS